MTIACHFVLSNASSTFADLLLHNESNPHATYDQSSRMLKWNHDRESTDDKYQGVMIKWLRFCYGENQSFDVDECPAALAVFFQLQFGDRDEIKNMIERHMIDAATNNVERGVRLLNECTIKYEECHNDHLTEVDVDLARIVFAQDNITNNPDAVIEGCLLALPPRYLDTVQYGDVHTEFRIRSRYINSNQGLSLWNKHRIMAGINRNDLSPAEIKELRRTVFFSCWEEWLKWPEIGIAAAVAVACIACVAGILVAMSHLLSASNEEGSGWSFNNNSKTLIVFGAVAMPKSRRSSNYQWYKFKSSVEHVVIEGRVKSVGSYAFDGYEKLRSIVLKKGIHSIGDYSFRGCSSLESVKIPSSVISIGDSSFYKCQNLASLKISS